MRNLLLLGASIVFYTWGEPKFVFIMMGSILANYFVGILMEKENPSKKLFLILGVAMNLLVLFVFKYLGLTCRIIDEIIISFHMKPLEIINLALPLGISFYTFQEITYLVDVYHGETKAQKNLFNLGLYITFFPQLVAGPIVRYHDICMQIEDRNESVSMFAHGLERFIVGLSKKMLLANCFAAVCDLIFSSDFFSYGVSFTWIAAVSYSLQIFYDFSGYSDMAIGLAGMFGFRLLENFDYPYSAASITDFWRRWHISLTNFFRDYIYIPLGGNRNGNTRTVLNRYIVFFLTGL